MSQTTQPIMPPKKPTKVLLFDIDGTLILTGGSANAALHDALEQTFGVAPDLGRILIAGVTDRGIARQMLEKNGIPATAENLDRLLAAYLALLERYLPEHGTGGVLPGVPALIAALRQRDDALVGLLTGNLEYGARVKLVHYGLWHHFTFGAYADDSEHRNDLGPIAHARAAQILDREVAPEDVYVIGDTPRDIECGKIFGARTIAVATGEYTTDALRADTPDFLFENFGDTQSVLAAFASS